MVQPGYSAYFIAMEVEALHLIREKTSLPVPEIYAWGLARENQLGLGPFMLINFINGICLGEVFGGGNSRLFREDIPDADIEYVYRQMAHFMLQLCKIDFSQIGSLPTLKKNFPAPGRPLTWKAHEILRVGGVDTFGSCLIPDLINTSYDRGPFNIICDDFGIGNVIVRSKNDLTITGVVDMEWVYTGPAQLFGSAPWWLVMDRPVNEEWDFEVDDAPEGTDRYFKYLDILKSKDSSQAR
ncbi:hypothetical protein BDV34DRAFT_215386 [Aspergillus parasiticus]|uniref:Aminoglycoside phosphotransferase domain-containing protein n=1 Tax=Aspergillus parasiticus TaxID=5067 RepID=A0A5N6DBW0_ASPPA|nr:hypothetical protein BDV34DRAFT_215386 [Aspergillus parasiticus]